ncbi:MAG: chorismate mutase [Chloroflexota bacterium]|nr:chorismate mutase [Candidatus Sulfotelmatobacter sp.]
MQDIQRLRKRIDQIDENILQLLGERAEICRSIGILKKEQGLPVIDTFRENEVFSNIRVKAADFGLDADQVEAIYRQIVNMCSSVQELKEKTE